MVQPAATTKRELKRMLPPDNGVRVTISVERQHNMIRTAWAASFVWERN
jgi:hypothetical protein